jgi:hypothetical protein
MRGGRTILFLFLICAEAAGAPDSPAGDPESPAHRLAHTRAQNLHEIIDAQFPGASAAEGFRVADPYAAQALDTVRRWYENPDRQIPVCAVRFLDYENVDYELRDFDTASSAIAAGFSVTHHGRCGSCSTLRDLAVYLNVPDLATPARSCARRFGLGGKKQCLRERTGLSEYCAESWAYNMRNTRRECLGTCVADYGFWNLLFNRPAGPSLDEAGRLRPCIRCDEEKSGPGFKFSAGRTRRNSGIKSAIPRPAEEVLPVDHEAYFKPESIIP